MKGSTLTTRLAWCFAFVVVVAFAGPRPVGAQGKTVGAWDQSIALEAKNDLKGAERVLLDAYGATPQSYDVSLRLAWLSLRMREPNVAIERYRRARGMKDATPEATQGLASALTMGGFVAIDRGDMAAARGAFGEAVTLDPHLAKTLLVQRVVGPFAISNEVKVRLQ